MSPIELHDCAVVFTADDRYALPLAVAMRSFADHAPAGLPIDVIDGGLTEESRRRIARFVGDRELRWISPALCPLPPLGGVWRYVSPTVFLRLQLPLLISARRALFLDADVLVLDRIEHLLRCELAGAPLAAVRDPSSTGPPALRQHGFPEGTPYFNAGVLVLDLDELRRLDAARVFWELAHRELPFNDQDVLNLWAAGRWRELPTRWNCPAHSADVPDAEVSIVHFIGPRKPWHADGPLLPRYADWQRYAALSGWPRDALSDVAGMQEALALLLRVAVDKIATDAVGFDRQQFLDRLFAAIDDASEVPAGSQDAMLDRMRQRIIRSLRVAAGLWPELDLRALFRQLRASLG